jgi:hypothetical protein
MRARVSNVDQAVLGATTLPTVDETPPPATQIMRSEFDNFRTTYAKRQEHKARIVRENDSVRDAMMAALRWVDAYITSNYLESWQIKVTGSMSPEGAVILQIAPTEED